MTVAVVVLSGVRDDSWSVLSWVVPLGLVGTGLAALAGAARGPSRPSSG